jgi:hypothetical protein
MLALVEQYVDPYTTKLAQLKKERDGKAALQDKVDEKKQAEELPAKFANLEAQPFSGARQTLQSTPGSAAKTPAPESPGQSELARLASARSAGIQEKLQALEGLTSPRGSGRVLGDGGDTPSVRPSLCSCQVMRSIAVAV